MKRQRLSFIFHFRSFTHSFLLTVVSLFLFSSIWFTLPFINYNRIIEKEQRETTGQESFIKISIFRNPG